MGRDQHAAQAEERMAPAKDEAEESDVIISAVHWLRVFWPVVSEQHLLFVTVWLQHADAKVQKLRNNQAEKDVF